MLKPLLLLAYLLQPDGWHVYVLDSGLTRDDCRAALAAGVSAADLGHGETVDLSRATLACADRVEPAPRSPRH